MNNLIELLNQIDFSVLDIDKLLDGRESNVFDTEWIRVYKTVELLKNEENYFTAEKNSNSTIREIVFKKIYEFSNDGDLAGYVSDDFGLIADAELLGYKDDWLDKLISCYENKTIPSGRL